MMQHSQRAKLHYLLALFFISIYGIHVCPFIEGLTTIELATPLIIIVGLQYFLRHQLIPRVVYNSNYTNQVTRSFQLEWSLFLLSGVLLTVSNSVIL